MARAQETSAPRTRRIWLGRTLELVAASGETRDRATRRSRGQKSDAHEASVF
jgi:hypothetical protein